MGLDSVELVMEWEDAFGIAIPDAVAETLQTPRCATDYVFSQLEQRRATECIRQQIFFRLRRGFRRAIGEPSVRFAPATKLHELVSGDDWPAVWSAVRREAPVASWSDEAPFVAPSDFRTRTVGDLVNELAIADPRGRHDGGSLWTREQVSLEVRRVMAATIGVRFFAEDDEFVRDLGLQ